MKFFSRITNAPNVLFKFFAIFSANSDDVNRVSRDGAFSVLGEREFEDRKVGVVGFLGRRVRFLFHWFWFEQSFEFQVGFGECVDVVLKEPVIIEPPGSAPMFPVKSPGEVRGKPVFEHFSQRVRDDQEDMPAFLENAPEFFECFFQVFFVHDGEYRNNEIE